MRRAYSDAFERRQQELNEIMQRLGVPVLQASTDSAPFSLLQTYYGNSRR